MNKKGKLRTVNLILTILGFLMILGGSYITRFYNDTNVIILAGIIVSIGLGLLAFAKNL